MQDAKTISTSRVKLHLDMAKASGMYDLWRLSKPKTPDWRKAYVSCEDMFGMFRGKACIRKLIRGNMSGHGKSVAITLEHGIHGSAYLPGVLSWPVKYHQGDGVGT